MEVRAVLEGDEVVDAADEAEGERGELWVWVGEPEVADGVAVGRRGGGVEAGEEGLVGEGGGGGGDEKLVDLLGWG